MSHLFISYSKHNRVYARQLTDYLLAWGFDVWIDDRIQHGEEWERVIFTAIEECQVFLVIMTPESYESHWVLRECQYAEKCHKPTMPLLLAGDEFPRYGPTQFADVRDGQMPPAAFLEHLSSMVPRRHSSGHEFNARIPAPPAPDGDMDTLIKSFFMAFAARQWEAALQLLARLRTCERLPKTLEPDFYEALIWKELEQSVLPTPVATTLPTLNMLLAVLDSPDATPLERGKAGIALAEQGDPRPGVGVTYVAKQPIPDIDWIEVPGGELLYQKKSRMEITPFYMARYPVTVSQFAAFVEADGYSNPAYWDYQSARWKGSRTRPNLWQHPRWHVANHPVVGVTWYEAQAFCRWLSLQLACEVRLPNEYQWERAAMGNYTETYPWGETYQCGYANVNEKWLDETAACLERTAAVGAFPYSQSPYGLMDMVGNVWEWCSNNYEATSSEDKGCPDKALRGGSWCFGPTFASPFVRTGYNPYQDNDDIGFRVVVRK